MKKLILIITVAGVIALACHPVKSDDTIDKLDKLDKSMDKLCASYERLCGTAWSNGVAMAVFISHQTNINNMKLDEIISECKKSEMSFIKK